MKNSARQFSKTKSSPVTPKVADSFSISEAAAKCHCSVSTIRRRINDGSIAAYRPGHEIMIRKTDIERYIKSRRIQPFYSSQNHRSGT